MNNCSRLLTGIFIIAVLAGPAIAQQSPAGTKAYIAPFKGGRKAAVCYTFDDGIKDQYTLAYPMLKKYGLKATFFVIPSQIIPAGIDPASDKKYRSRISETQLKEMANNGMEIGNHSWSHSKNLTTLNGPQLRDEVNKADSTILRITGTRAISFAYPWNAFDARTQAEVLTTHIAAREFQFGIGSRFTTKAGNDWIDGLIRKGGWGTAMIHAISSGFDSLESPAVLDKHLAYVKQRENDIWVTTFGDLATYRLVRESAVLRADVKTKKAKITITRNGMAAGFETPLTIVLPVSGTARSAKARQDGKKLPVRYENGYLLIDAWPNGHAVDVRWK